MKIAFIGGGNMAEAILSAVLAKGLAEAADITVSDISDEKRGLLKQKYQVAVTDDNAGAVKGKEIVVLAVKPQVLTEVAAQLKGRLKPGKLVICFFNSFQYFFIDRSRSNFWYSSNDM